MQSRHRIDVATWLAVVVAVFLCSSVQADDEKKTTAQKGAKKSASAEPKNSHSNDKKEDHTKGEQDKQGDHGKDDQDKQGHQKADTHGKTDDVHGGGHGDGHGEHDESDLGHGNASAALEDPKELRTDLALFSFVVFIGLLVILRVFAWGPIMEGLTKREQGIADNIARAEQNAAAAEQRAQEYEVKLAEAAEEARSLVAQARTDAEAARERILAEADEARQRDRTRFLADIEAAKNAAIGEVAQKGAEIAVALAGRIVRRELTAGDHAQLIKDSLDSFPSNN